MIRKFLIGVFMLLIGLATLILFIFLQELTAENNDSDPTKRVKIMEKDLYNGYGLPMEQDLSTEIIYEKDGIVAYSDRIFRLFSYKEDNVKQTARLMLELRKRLPKTITLSVMPIPPRSTIVENYGEQEQLYSNYLNMLGNELTEEVYFIDVSSTLHEHREEYIYFRTEESWTALGAYYAAVEVAKVLGIEPISLESYDEHMYKKFIGSILQNTMLLLKEGTDEHDKVTSIPNDMLYYYLLPNGNNQTEVWKNVDGQFISSKSPTITKSRPGTSAFVGGNQFDWAVVEGDKKSDEKADDSLLLISDYNGKILAPYFANYYERVVVVNISEYKDFVTNLDSIIQKYQVTDVVFAQKAENMGISSVSRAINPLVAE